MPPRRNPNLRPRDAVGIVVVVGAALAAMTLPNVFGDHSSAGWQLTHTVDLPEGWQTTAQRVTATDSTSALQADPSLLTPEEQQRGDFPACLVTVHAPGAEVPLPSGPEAEAVTVNGTAATYVALNEDNTDEPFGVYWPGAGGAWANVWCQLSRDQTVAMAERVQFASTPVQTPIRLDGLVAGYHADAVENRVSDTEPGTRLTLRPDAADSPDPWLVAFSYPGTVEDLGPGTETLTIAGRPAVARAYTRQVCFVGEPIVCAGEDATDPMGNDETWPPGERDRLVELASHLVVAEKSDDRTTWFDAGQAFPL